MRSVHPEEALIVRYLDDELSMQETRRIEAHLAACCACRERQESLTKLSGSLTVAVNTIPVMATAEERAKLARELEESAAAGTPSFAADRVMRRFGWGIGIAAMVALALLFAPGTKVTVQQSPAAVSTRLVSSLDVNGETFIALPYSNPDLPLNAPRIVEMEIPASALAEAGIAFPPAPNGTGDGMVAANVLLGIDGQPLGLHVLGMN